MFQAWSWILKTQGEVESSPVSKLGSPSWEKKQNIPVTPAIGGSQIKLVIQNPDGFCLSVGSRIKDKFTGGTTELEPEPREAFSRQLERRALPKQSCEEAGSQAEG